MNYYIRLDDASEKRDINRWDKIEILFDKFDIKPLVGVIPNCEDDNMLKYKVDDKFWNRVKDWDSKGWIIALHGYNHVCITKEGGVNPVNARSEFAGVPLDDQKRKIAMGLNIFKSHGIYPCVFFAPSHTFDLNTIEAIKCESSIRVISDTIANEPYTENGITFVPQQCGRVRLLPFNTVTFCYHPNNMKDSDFDELSRFIVKHRKLFKPFPLEESFRKRNFYDRLLSQFYFRRR